MSINRKSLKFTNASDIRMWDYTHAELQGKPLLVIDFRLSTLLSNEVVLASTYVLDEEDWDKREPYTVLFGATALKNFITGNSDKLPIAMKVGDLETSKTGREYYTVKGLTEEEITEYLR